MMKWQSVKANVPHAERFTGQNARATLPSVIAGAIVHCVVLK
jgi:hypothetical protein